MPRDSKRIEKLLKSIRSNIALVREEMAEGFDLGHMRNDLERHEQILQGRITELREHNQREAAAATKAGTPAEKPN